jgi:hypothetical protein
VKRKAVVLCCGIACSCVRCGRMCNVCEKATALDTGEKVRSKRQGQE